MGYASEKKMPVWTSWPVWPRQKLESVCVNEDDCVGYLIEKKMSMWTSLPVRAVIQARNRLCG